MQSKIFCHQLDFDEWPSTHPDPEKYLKGYNGSYFDLRSKYSEIFNIVDQYQNEDQDFDATIVKEDVKVYKISY